MEITSEVYLASIILNLLYVKYINSNTSYFNNKPSVFFLIALILIGSFLDTLKENNSQIFEALNKFTYPPFIIKFIESFQFFFLVRHWAIRHGTSTISHIYLHVCVYRYNGKVILPIFQLSYFGRYTRELAASVSRVNQCYY